MTRARLQLSLASFDLQEILATRYLSNIFRKVIPEVKIKRDWVAEKTIISILSSLLSIPQLDSRQGVVQVPNNLISNKVSIKLELSQPSLFQLPREDLRQTSEQPRCTRNDLHLSQGGFLLYFVCSGTGQDNWQFEVSISSDLMGRQDYLSSQPCLTISYLKIYKMNEMFSFQIFLLQSIQSLIIQSFFSLHTFSSQLCCLTLPHSFIQDFKPLPFLTIPGNHLPTTSST